MTLKKDFIDFKNYIKPVNDIPRVKVAYILVCWLHDKWSLKIANNPLEEAETSRNYNYDKVDIITRVGWYNEIEVIEYRLTANNWT